MTPQAALLKHGDVANAEFGQASARWRVLQRAAAGQPGRIVNMSGGLGSLTLSSDPGSEFAHYNLFPGSRGFLIRAVPW